MFAEVLASKKWIFADQKDLKQSNHPFATLLKMVGTNKKENRDNSLEMSKDDMAYQFVLTSCNSNWYKIRFMVTIIIVNSICKIIHFLTTKKFIHLNYFKPCCDNIFLALDKFNVFNLQKQTQQKTFSSKIWQQHNPWNKF